MRVEWVEVRWRGSSLVSCIGYNLFGKREHSVEDGILVNSRFKCVCVCVCVCVHLHVLNNQ